MNTLATALGLMVATIALWAALERMAGDEPVHPAPSHATHGAAVEVTGWVLDAGGQPVPGAMVVASSMDDAASALPPSQGGVLTDRDGHFVLSRVAPGRYSVVAIHGDHPPGMGILVVAASDRAAHLRVEIVLDRADEVMRV